MGAMRRRKCVIDENIAIRRKLRDKGRVVLFFALME
jgi:hypothetical protein